MTCAELMDSLLDYLGEEMVVEVRETFRIHIEGCPRCGAYVATYTHTVRVSRVLPTRDLPAAFAARLRAALEPELGE